jgi:hypothetical protein
MGDDERDGASRYDSSSCGSLNSPSGRRRTARTASGRAGGGGEGLATAGSGGVNGGEVLCRASSCKRSMAAIIAWWSADLFQSRCCFLA